MQTETSLATDYHGNARTSCLHRKQPGFNPLKHLETSQRSHEIVLGGSAARLWGAERFLRSDINAIKTSLIAVVSRLRHTGGSVQPCVQVVFDQIVSVSCVQFKEFLGTYNKVTENCFMDCVRDFTTRDVKPEESSCSESCLQKYLKMTQRISMRFQEYHIQQNEALAAKAGLLGQPR
nr:PREDICTED: mitochondrial import inner membrane translocase subunit Tim9 [Pundamilia nyererei]